MREVALFVWQANFQILENTAVQTEDQTAAQTLIRRCPEYALAKHLLFRRLKNEKVEYQYLSYD